MNLFRKICLTAVIVGGFSWQNAIAESIKVDFENGIPEGWSTTGTVTVKKDNNSNRAAMSSNATIASPALKGVTTVSYKHRGSGNNKELVVEASADGGASWTQIGSTKTSSSSTYGSASHSVGLGMSDPVSVRFTCKSSTIYVDDIEISYVSIAEEPTVAPVVSIKDITGESASVDIAPGNGEGRLIAYMKGSDFTFQPADGQSFTGSFPKVADGAVLIASGDITSANLSGLEPATTYTVAAFEFNGQGEARNYLTAEVSTVKFTTAAVPTISLSAESVDFKNTKVGTSKERTIKISGKYLDPSEGELTVSLPAGSAFSFADGKNVVSFPYTGASLETSVKITFSPADYQDYVAVAEIQCGSLTKTLSLKGRGTEISNNEYFIAPDGDDSGAGTIESPWLNLQKAVNAAIPGDVIYCRGGRYNFTTRDSSGKLTVRIKTSGTAEAPITIRAWEDEQPIFDFEQQLIDCERNRSKVGDRGIHLTGNYWHLYGLHITHAADNGIKLEGSHNRIERCEFSYNLDSGIQLGFGHNFADSGLGSKNDGSFCAYNDIIDCDSHHNCDFDANYGSDADGFACKMHNGIGNRFIRCRAWRNSDDAWDLYETDYSVVLIECWAWESGKADDHTWVYEYFDKGPSFSGNGNGIKLGGNGSGGSSQGVHYAYNCIVFGCDKSGSTKGFDCNSHKGGHVVVGGLAFDNGYDFMFESGGGSNSEFYNNVCFGRQEILVGTESHNALGVTPNQGKTFFNNVITDFSRSDYESLEEADAIAPRGEDGSLPPRFGRLRSGSKLVDAGKNIAVPFTDEFTFLYQPIYGEGRDLGPYELKEGTMSGSVQMILTAEKEDSISVRPSGRSNEIIATITSAESTDVTLDLYTLSGSHAASIYLGHVDPGTAVSFPVSVDIHAGAYMAVANLGHTRMSAKLIIR